MRYLGSAFGAAIAIATVSTFNLGLLAIFMFGFGFSGLGYMIGGILECLMEMT